MENHEKHEIEVIDLEDYSKKGICPPIGKRYKVKIEDQYYIFDHHLVSGKEIVEKRFHSHPECHSLYIKLAHCDFDKIGLSETIDLAQKGIEHFVIKPTDVFTYKLDGESEMTDKKELTPNEILELGGVTPIEDYYIVLKNADGTEVSYKGRSTERIKMRCPAMTFVSIFNGEVPVS